MTSATAAAPASPPAVGAPVGLPRRLVARAVDVAIVAALDVALGQVMGFGFDWLAAGTVIVLGYFVLLDVVVGATVGKLLVGVRVVGEDGGKPTLRQALVRELFVVVGSIPFIGAVLALGAWIWFSVTLHKSPTHQGQHDVWAGTRVVRAR
jgi:uncharacterized RDD family membrane protein YckC